MTGKEEDNKMAAWPAWLGKRPRDASLQNEEDEPQVRRARSQEEHQPEPNVVSGVPEAAGLPSSSSAAAELPASSSWPLNHKNDSKIPASVKRPMAERLKDYVEPGGTKKWSPRPEWYRPFVGRKRPREASPPPPRAEALLPPVVVAAAGEAAAQQQQQQQRQGRVEAPADGLLPDDAFVHFLQQQQHVAQPPPQPPAVPAVDVSAAGVAETVASTESLVKEEPAALEPRLATFGRDCDSALHVAIRQLATEAALELIELGASVHAENAKAVTPLLLASQKGNYPVVQELWKRGASLQQASHSGSTPLLQAAHFGHFDIVKFLFSKGASMEKANDKNTTPLMRAAQEGHFDIVSLFVKNGVEVNRLNNEQMSALMLASQRGHASIVQLLIDSGAMLDATTQQDSTSLMLACKRGHVNVVRVLVTEGCEIWIRDSRGRTAKDMAVRKNAKELAKLLDPDVQVNLMQRKARIQRNHTMIQMWTLLQQERAHVPLMHNNVSIHEVGKDLLMSKGSRSALIRTMTLPAPLVELVSSFLPLPHLWDRRRALIVKRCTVDPDAAIASSLEIIDEVLDEGGFVEACDEAQVTPPTNFSSWVRHCFCFLEGKRFAFLPTNEADSHTMIISINSHAHAE